MQIRWVMVKQRRKGCDQALSESAPPSSGQANHLNGQPMSAIGSEKSLFAGIEPYDTGKYRLTTFCNSGLSQADQVEPTC